MYVNTYTWNLENGIDDFIYRTETETQRQRTDIWIPRGKRGETNWELRMDTYTLLTTMCKTDS